ncbi:hypothetical protein AWB71_05244 [Caballeronia peredens]|nr:hypothetical protein AWB71_05244 [Caballeronia peredens]
MNNTDTNQKQQSTDTTPDYFFESEDDGYCD